MIDVTTKASILPAPERKGLSGPKKEQTIAPEVGRRGANPSLIKASQPPCAVISPDSHAQDLVSYPAAGMQGSAEKILLDQKTDEIGYV